MITKNLSIFKVLSTLITTKWDPEYCYFCAKAIPFSMTSFHRDFIEDILEKIIINSIKSNLPAKCVFKHFPQIEG